MSADSMMAAIEYARAHHPLFHPETREEMKALERASVEFLKAKGLDYIEHVYADDEPTP